MSADLSDSAIISAINSINDPVSPISWLALCYHPTADKTLLLVNTGFDPWVPRWQEVIEHRKREPLFGYGLVGKGRLMREGGEKGVVLVYLPGEVTGVRRARAVVHSRALANRFPDHSAIITISDPSQISEDFVRSQVNFYNRPVPTPTSSPIKPRTSAQLGLGYPSNGRTSPLPSPQIRSVQTSSSSTRSMDRPLPPPPAEPIKVPDHSSTSPRAPSPTATSPNRRNRKDSLSSRFAKALPSFRSSGEASPMSSSKTTFASLTSGFGKGRRDASGNEVHAISERDGDRSLGADGMTNQDGPSGPSPTPQQTVANGGEESHIASQSLPPQSPPPPPLPPKSLNPPPLNRLHTLGPVVDQTLPANTIAHTSSDIPLQNADALITPFPSHVSSADEHYASISTDLHHYKPHDAQLPRDGNSSRPSNGRTAPPAFPVSPTASAALSTAREKQLYAETRLHEEFRRTEEERRQRVNFGPREADTESEEGLPYDHDDTQESKVKREASGKRRGLVLATISGSDTDDDKKHSPPPVYASRVDLGRQMETSEPIADVGAVDMPNPPVPSAQDAVVGVSQNPKWSEEELREIRLMEERRVLEEQAQQEEERVRLERGKQERQAVLEREAEQRRLEKEEQERRAVRLREEEERRKHHERMDADRRAKEEEEEKARLAEEAVRARENSFRAGIQHGKATDGMMLHGHVTVQTTRSVTWRRRHFQLFPSEIRLFKTDTDTIPIQSIPLLRAQVTQTYEESQVQGSFKIICQAEDFFLFLDSAEEKEELLEGLSVALE